MLSPGFIFLLFLASVAAESIKTVESPSRTAEVAAAHGSEENEKQKEIQEKSVSEKSNQEAGGENSEQGAGDGEPEKKDAGLAEKNEDSAVKANGTGGGEVPPKPVVPVLIPKARNKRSVRCANGRRRKGGKCQSSKRTRKHRKQRRRKDRRRRRSRNRGHRR